MNSFKNHKCLLKDPEVKPEDFVPVQVAAVNCTSDATDIRDCSSEGWGTDAECEYKDVVWLSCED